MQKSPSETDILSVQCPGNLSMVEFESNELRRLTAAASNDITGGLQPGYRSPLLAKFIA